ncbi:hypothetical protein GVAV_002061 [Gurleya vavrai]
MIFVKADMMSSGMQKSSLSSGMSQSASMHSQSSGGTQQITSGTGQKSAMLQQAGQLGAALQQVTGQAVGGGSPEDVTQSVGPNGETLICSKKGVEGEMNKLNDEMKKKCIEKNQSKEVIAQKVAQKARNETAKECHVKVDKESMFCHTRKVVRNVIEAPIYELNFYGNVAELKKHGETLLLAVIENLNYTITKNPVQNDDRLKKPNVSIVFNELGGLLSQTGDLPAPKKDDPCAQCLESVNKEANTLEGSTDDCNASCDSVLLNSLVKPAHFREVQNGNAAAQTGDKGQTKPAEGGGEEGNAQQPEV